MTSERDETIPAEVLTEDEVNRVATLLFDTWRLSDPFSNVSTFPASYTANFADMARAIMADRATRPSSEALQRAVEDEPSQDEIDMALMRPFANDFAAMTEEEIEDEERRSQREIEDHEPWLEACAARRRLADRAIRKA